MTAGGNGSRSQDHRIAPTWTLLAFGLALFLCSSTACSSEDDASDGAASGDGDSTGEGDGDGDADGDTPPPPASTTCPTFDLVDVSTPTSTVGSGSSESCTEAALRSAVEAGGRIVFDCGEDPVTIEVGSALVATEETVLDGGDTVTLSGGGGSRILYLDSGYDTPEPRLTVQRLRFVDGRAPAEGEDTAQGGGAIYRDGGSLTVIDCSFENNHAPAPGQDIAGGAIYAFGGGDTIIATSTFLNNSASNGGAVGSLNGDLTIVSSVFSRNAALGTDGNPGNGGCGGALYQDGRDEVTSLCGVVIDDNEAGAIGGGVFRVSNTDDGTWSLSQSSVTDNEVTPDGEGNAGGLYLQGLDIAMNAVTIARNVAYYGGGVWFNESSVEVVNTTIAENSTKGSNGAGVWLGREMSGRFLNCTIADNASGGDGSVAGGIFGEGVTLQNTIVLNNTARYTKTCTKMQSDGGGNVQFPDNSLCTESPLTEDPLLSPLAGAEGEPEVMVPGQDSPAKGLGTDCPELDQVGEPRSQPCTAGAVE